MIASFFRCNKSVCLLNLVCLPVVFSTLHGQGQTVRTQPQPIDSNYLYLADPSVFYHQGTYYLYGTGARDGFPVYTSANLKEWTRANGGYALKQGDAFGTAQFWAPQVFQAGSRFYMAYAANEHLAIASGPAPYGPFTQPVKEALDAPVKQIDPFVFVDDDGKKYLYHVRLLNGNRIFVAELNNDFSAIKPETLRECINAADGWENTAHSQWPVAEGPSVLKHKNLYYLFYSANDFRNPDYAVGYAVSSSPLGPWKKYSGNPVLSRQLVKQNGTGHGDFVQDAQQNLVYVFHTHYSDSVVSPRKTALIRMKFETVAGSAADQVVADPSSFYFVQPKRKL